MLRLRRVSSTILVLFIILAAVFLYDKSVQANRFKSEFTGALEQGKYDNAYEVHKRANDDSIIKKYFSFNEKSQELLNNELEALKQKYSNDTITYSELREKVKELAKITSSPYEEELKSFQEIESMRQAYTEAKKLSDKKKYIEAVKKLKTVSGMDKLYYEKAQVLMDDINKRATEEVNVKIQGYMKNNRLENGLKLLEDNKSVLDEDFYESNVNKLKEMQKKKSNVIKTKSVGLTTEEKEKVVTANGYLKGYVPNREKEDIVRKFSSSTQFLVWVDLNQQKTNVFVGKKGDWKLIKSFVSSTGTKGNETPKGFFRVTKRGTWFYSQKYQEGAKYWVQFYGNYLFHSVPMDINKNIVDSTLGIAASHGCVRLSLNDSAWIYNNITVGTTVYIK
ncbi:hypothetical protein CPJCM30710_32460 [Clostridium polyendosporum]|uniref:L,D-TPase catalytic domain-containing protein n=1 Tax=Clostridium polyendosporum TaxID=69208 RepID=A0A919S3I4_9CLOT|nr:L,D-transpeptidase family protein [Clostridium polyendosporum]GIM30580.1 hypothetical protein CPJCM30710_32460 [Clostridium polyendosporum]